MDAFVVLHYGRDLLAERVGFVHLRGFHSRASCYGGQVAAPADLIVSVGFELCQLL